MVQIQPLSGHHNRSGFECGVPALDHWLKQTALQHQLKGVSRTFVAVTAHDKSPMRSPQSLADTPVASTEIFGYYALAAGFVLVEQLPATVAKRYPRQIPITRLGRLAISAALQRQGLGRLLLADAIQRARGAALAVGSAGIFVDAKDAVARNFYAAYGFTSCADDPLKLYLPMW